MSRYIIKHTSSYINELNIMMAWSFHCDKFNKSYNDGMEFPL